jgi:hypothetical protein
MMGSRTGARAEKSRLPAPFSFPAPRRRAAWKALGLIPLLVLALIHLASAAIPLFSISPSRISFPDLDPSTYPEVQALSLLEINFRATSLQSGEKWTLEFCPNSDLTSGPATIPISGTASPVGSFQNGTLSRNVYQRAGIGPGNAGNHQADVTASTQFYLKNSWAYQPGTYTALLDVRVSIPDKISTLSATLTITIAPRVSLTLGMSAINFPAADPDLIPSIPANENPITVRINAKAGGGLTLTCRAGNDLVSGSNIIPAASVSWTATGTQFVSGTMSKTSDQLAGQWTGSGSWNGTFSYRLANSWSYATGAYSFAVIYTLTTL